MRDNKMRDQTQINDRVEALERGIVQLKKEIKELEECLGDQYHRFELLMEYFNLTITYVPSQDSYQKVEPKKTKWTGTDPRSGGPLPPG